MTQKDNTANRHKFQHLTKEKRAQITQAAGISRSTLYHELERGTVGQIDTNLKPYQAYFWDAGQRVYKKRNIGCVAVA